MAATRLPDGSVVARPSGQRAYPTGKSGATVARAPGTRAGAGPSARVGGAVRSNQPGRTAVSRDAYK